MTALLNPELTQPNILKIECRRHLKEIVGETFAQNNARLYVNAYLQQIKMRDIALFNKVAQYHEITRLENKSELIYSINVPKIIDEESNQSSELLIPWTVSLDDSQRGSFITHYGGNYTIE